MLSRIFTRGQRHCAGLDDGSRGVLRNERGSMTIAIRFDSRVLPEVVHVAVGPRRNNSESLARVCPEGILSLADVQKDGSWRVTMATIEKS